MTLGRSTLCPLTNEEVTSVNIYSPAIISKYQEEDDLRPLYFVPAHHEEVTSVNIYSPAIISKYSTKKKMTWPGGWSMSKRRHPGQQGEWIPRGHSEYSTKKKMTWPGGWSMAKRRHAGQQGEWIPRGHSEYSTNRTLRCVKLLCLIAISMFIIIMIICHQFNMFKNFRAKAVICIRVTRV
jgi:hypothetical protein